MGTKTQMQLSSRQLVKDWIQYLKNNQIIRLQSDQTGKLSYKRNPTTSDLLTFLDIHTDIDQSTIKKAIQTALSQRKSSKNLPSTWLQNEIRPDPEEPKNGPDARSRTNSRPPESPPSKKYSNDDAEDVEFRDVDDKTPDHLALTGPKRKPRFKYRNKPIAEAFYDGTDDVLDEDQIRLVFKLLAAGSLKRKDLKREPEESSEETAAKTSENMNKLRRLIRDKLSPEQRVSLWRILNANSNINEEYVSRPDAIDIFHNISSLNKGIDVNDLQKAWRDQHFPDDTADIYAILVRHGFSNKEIEKVFDKVLGPVAGENDTEEASPAIKQLAEFIKKVGLEDSIKDYMQSEYGDELTLSKSSGVLGKIKNYFSKKVMTEDIRKIFMEIVKEERTNSPALLRSYEIKHLGRIKK